MFGDVWKWAGVFRRTETDVLMENVFGQEPFSWRAAGMVSAGEERKMYIAALRTADRGDFAPLLKFVEA